MRNILLLICFWALPALASDVYNFSVSPAETVSGPGDLFTLTGWGYTIQNESSTDWLVTTGLNAGTFLYATPQLFFDFPDLAPGMSVTVPYDPVTPAGVYQISWDQNAPAGFVNSGTFTLSAQWWSGDPLAGGTFLSTALNASQPYTTATATPEPAAITLTVLPLLALGVMGVVRRLKHSIA